MFAPFLENNQRDWFAKVESDLQEVEITHEYIKERDSLKTKLETRFQERIQLKRIRHGLREIKENAKNEWADSEQKGTKKRKETVERT